MFFLGTLKNYVTVVLYVPVIILVLKVYMMCKLVCNANLRVCGGNSGTIPCNASNPCLIKKLFFNLYFQTFVELFFIFRLCLTQKK